MSKWHPRYSFTRLKLQIIIFCFTSLPGSVPLCKPVIVSLDVQEFVVRAAGPSFSGRRHCVARFPEGFTEFSSRKKGRWQLEEVQTSQGQQSDPYACL